MEGYSSKTEDRFTLVRKNTGKKETLEKSLKGLPRGGFQKNLTFSSCNEDSSGWEHSAEYLQLIVQVKRLSTYCLNRRLESSYWTGRSMATFDLRNNKAPRFSSPALMRLTFSPISIKHWVSVLEEATVKSR